MSKASVRIEVEGRVLELETDQFTVFTPHDVVDVTPPGQKTREMEFTGISHVQLSATFAPGDAPRWVDRA